jgi:Mrp family chromosome partitioning ATPase
MSEHAPGSQSLELAAAQSQLVRSPKALPTSPTPETAMREPRAETDPFRFQPTVIDAVRRYPVMVVVIALLAATVAAGYTRLTPRLYRAEASLTVPKQLAIPEQSADQYLDSQVLILRSPDVAEGAVAIANGFLPGAPLDVHDFSGQTSKLVITPPEAANPGTYGASIVNVSFTWPDARTAKVAVNALLQSFDNARYAATKAAGDRTLDGIDRTIIDSRSNDQRSQLRAQRAQVLVNQQIDLGHHPTFAWAPEPQTPINEGAKRAGIIGLLLGAFAGTALALARAVRRPRFADSKEPAAVYGAPLLGQMRPASRRNGSTRTEGESSLPMALDRHSMAAEEFRFAAGRIARLPHRIGWPLALGVVSPVATANKSRVVANLALALAEGGARVLAVDADPGRALTSLLLSGAPPADSLEEIIAARGVAVDHMGDSSAQRLGDHLGDYLGDYLGDHLGDYDMGDQVADHVTDHVQGSPWNPALDVLVVGLPMVRGRGTASGRGLPAIIDEAKPGYDFLVIDAPPLLTSAEALDLDGVTDAVLVVAGSKELIRDHMETAGRLSDFGWDVTGYVYVRVGRSRRRLLRRPWRRFLPSSPTHERRRPTTAVRIRTLSSSTGDD